MPRGLATVIFALGILCLFMLDWDRTPRPSRVLWMPVAWLAIGASRSVSEWLGASSMMQSPDRALGRQFYLPRP